MYVYVNVNVYVYVYKRVDISIVTMGDASGIKDMIEEHQS